MWLPSSFQKEKSGAKWEDKMKFMDQTQESDNNAYDIQPDDIPNLIEADNLPSEPILNITSHSYPLDIALKLRKWSGWFAWVGIILKHQYIIITTDEYKYLMDKTDSGLQMFRQEVEKVALTLSIVVIKHFCFQAALLLGLC